MHATDADADDDRGAVRPRAAPAGTRRGHRLAGGDAATDRTGLGPARDGVRGGPPRRGSGRARRRPGQSGGARPGVLRGARGGHRGGGGGTVRNGRPASAHHVRTGDAIGEEGRPGGAGRVAGCAGTPGEPLRPYAMPALGLAARRHVSGPAVTAAPATAATRSVAAAAGAPDCRRTGTGPARDRPTTGAPTTGPTTAAPIRRHHRHNAGHRTGTGPAHRTGTGPARNRPTTGAPTAGPTTAAPIRRRHRYDARHRTEAGSAVAGPGAVSRARARDQPLTPRRAMPTAASVIAEGSSAAPSSIRRTAASTTP